MFKADARGRKTLRRTDVQVCCDVVDLALPLARFRAATVSRLNFHADSSVPNAEVTALIEKE